MRIALNLPAAKYGNLTAYEQPPTVNELKDFFIELGYDLSAFKMKCLPARWVTLFSILNLCVTGKETLIDRGTNHIRYSETVSLRLRVAAMDRCSGPCPKNREEKEECMHSVCPIYTSI